MGSKTKTHETQTAQEQAPDVRVQRAHSYDMTLVTMAVVGIVVLVLFRRRKAPVAPQELTAEQEIEQAIAVLEKPRQIYAGRWFKHTIKMVECDPPGSDRPKPRIDHYEPQRAQQR